MLNEMIYNKENEKIMAGGYLVNSLLINEDKDKFSDIFKHLAVPAGLFYIQSKNITNLIDDDNDVISDDLYEKLLKLASNDTEPSKTEPSKTEPNKIEPIKKKVTRKKKFKKYTKNKTKRI